MDIGPLVLANISSKSDERDRPLVKLKNVLLKLMRRRKVAHKHDPACESDCEKQQDERLHELATRLHVLEWEAYGPEAAKRKKKKP